MALQPERVPTGIVKLDEALHGGLLRGRTHLVAGETGTGKTIFALQFLVTGAKQFDEAGIYVMVDEEPEELIRGARTLGWDLEELISMRKLSIMTLASDFVEKAREKEMDTVVRSIVRDIELEARRIGATRLVLDPIAPLIPEEERRSKLREYVRKLMMELERRVGCTIIATSEVPTGSNALSRYGVEEFLAAGVIVLKIEQTLHGYRRRMLVRKMRWTPIRPVEFDFDIVPGHGIVILGESQA